MSTTDTCDSDASPTNVVPSGDPQYACQVSIARSLILLSTLAIAYTLFFASAVIMPLVAALVLTALLQPLVRWMQRIHIPRSLSALLLTSIIPITIPLLIGQVIEPARSLLAHPEERMRELRGKLRDVARPIEQLQSVAAEVQDATASGISDGEKPTTVTLTQPSLINMLLSSTSDVVASLAVTLVLLFFLLVSGTTLQNSVLSLLPGSRERSDVIELVARIEHGVSRYLLSITAVNLGLGVAVAIAVAALGLPSPMMWGAMAACLNFVPYVGALAGVCVMFVASVLTFDSLAWACLPPAAYFLLNALEGNVITPLLLGRSLSLNPIFVLLSLTIWGWIWGIPGAILAVPLLAIAKITCEQFASLRSLATLFSGAEIAIPPEYPPAVPSAAIRVAAPL